MKKEWLVKTIALCVAILFIIVSYQPIIAENTKSVEKQSDNNNVDFEEAKEYLFQTLIGISNNPEVKGLLKQTNQKLLTSDCDYKDVFLQLLSKKPELLKSILFTRPEMTIEYLDKSYDEGVELINIIGEEESLDIVESVKITNLELFNELKNIVLGSRQLSTRISNLEKLNQEWNFPIICSILFIVVLSLVILYFGIAGIIMILFYFLAPILFLPFHLLIAPLIIIVMITADKLNCQWPTFPPYPY